MKQGKYAEDELLSLSGIQHFYFCKRQWALIHVERQWEDNLRTTEGHFLHERVDDPYFSESRGDVFISRAVPLVSFNLGFNGVADVVEYIHSKEGIAIPGVEGFWTLNPVEYKRGKPKSDERDEVQLCAQAICLEEMFGVNVDSADLYYHDIRRRVHLNISDSLRSLVFSLADEMHDVFKKGITPAAEKSKKCGTCSLENICMPKITVNKVPVAGYLKKHVDEALKND